MTRAALTGCDRGFTLMELLVALVVTLLIGGVVAAGTPAARAAFERVPVEIEMQQRGRTAIDRLSQNLRGASRISLDDPDGDGRCEQLSVVSIVANPAQGVLRADQAAAGSALVLRPAPCPAISDVCGFTTDSVALIAQDATGFDVFAVAATDAAALSITPDRLLSRAYAAETVVAEADEHTYYLDEQPDGSNSLVRMTAAGAIQPVVDHVADVTFSGDARLVNVAVTVQAPTAALRTVIPDRTYRTSIAVRNGS